MGVATGIAIGTAIAGIYAAHRTSESADRSADLTTTAATHGADLQDAATQRAEAFTRQQAENDWRNTEATRAANDRLQRARYAGAQTLGSSIGFNLPGMPDYVPTTDPHFDTGQTALPSTQTAPTSGPTPNGSSPSTTPNGDPIMAGLSDVYRGLGVSPTGRGTGPTDIAYYADVVRAHGGWTPENAGWVKDRIASDLHGGSGGAAARPAPAPTTLGQSMGVQAPMIGAAPAPALAQNPFYQPNTLGFAIGRRQ